MTLEEYQKFAHKGILIPTEGKDSLCHFAMGLCGESGEVCDAIKKRIFHGKNITDDYLIEELGDVMWYVANLCTELKVDINKVIELNVNKLKLRYKEMYQ